MGIASGCRLDNYKDKKMSEVCYKCAITLFNNGYEVYELHEDGTESLIMDVKEITDKKLYGVE